MTARASWRKRRRMERCIFVSDLHGRRDRYDKLFQLIACDKPEAVLIGGDFLPSAFAPTPGETVAFVNGYLQETLARLRSTMQEDYPRIFLIMGNDDERAREPEVLQLERSGLIEYIHMKGVALGLFWVYGYACVPPTPFLLKDWERYDVSRYVDPGCIPPEEGKYSYPVSGREVKFTTIERDLRCLAGDDVLDNAVFLFHAPPYGTHLDLADNDNVWVDGVLLDGHIGSIAVRRFIEDRQPLLTLHGHAHGSAARSGTWRDRIGRTHVFSAAHDGFEIAAVCFDLSDLNAAVRKLL